MAHHTNLFFPGPWTPDSSSSESSGGRPLLGRKHSRDDPVPKYSNSELGSRNSQAVSERSNTESCTALSVKCGETWGQDCNALTDLNSGINNSQESTWNGLLQPVGNHSGVRTSTGFYADVNPSRDSVYTSRLSQSKSNGVNGMLSYPRYSDGFNVENSEAISHAYSLANQLLHESSVSMTEKSGYRNFRSLEKFCAFCKKNGECREYYTTHIVKDSWGKVICPVLRRYMCPICGATGDNAHTLRHCPYNEDISLL